MKAHLPKHGKPAWSAEIVFAPGVSLESGLRSVSDRQRLLDVFLAGIPGATGDMVADLRLVCDEIGSNVVRHSGAERATVLRIEVEADERRVVLRLLDNGRQFDPFAPGETPYMGPDIAKRKVGGLGLHLVRRIFPRARYARRDGWNISEVEYPLARPDGGEAEKPRPLSALTRRSCRGRPGCRPEGGWSGD